LKKKEITAKQLSISKTPGEWVAIEKRVIESGKSDLNCYIRSEAMKIKMAYNKNPNCIPAALGNRVEKRPYLSRSIYEELSPIAIRLGVPVSTVIDRLIIAPLLLPKI